jgi:hypothetical protein
MTAGEPLFCNFCGRSYDQKLCPRLHENPRHAEVCSQCGSRDFSTPQPKVSLWWKFLGGSLRWVSGVVLTMLSVIVLMAMVADIINRPEMQSGLIVLGLLLLALWLLWGMLPDWFRKFVHKSIKRKERRSED